MASALQGEGKSTIAANLALAYVLEGARALLIDCDLRRPRGLRLLRETGQEIQAERGLSEYLKGDAQLGKISWSGGHSGAGDEVVMGNGSAKLDVEVVMGHAQVRVGSDRSSEAGVA